MIPEEGPVDCVVDDSGTLYEGWCSRKRIVLVSSASWLVTGGAETDLGEADHPYGSDFHRGYFPVSCSTFNK